MERFADHFSNRAREYAQFRPSYPSAWIQSLVSLAPARQLAWDAATGNGQAAVALASHFQQVVATDASLTQLAQAVPHPRIVYRRGVEDESGLGDRSADLVTVAQALHWLDLPRFYREVERVLKPKGVLAVWCYGLCRITPEIDAILERFYADRVGPYWAPQRRHVETGYSELPFPFEETPVSAGAIEARLSLDELLGYVGTWSAVSKATTVEGVDPLPDLEQALRPLWGEPGTVRDVLWPLRARVGRAL
jgi:ubiquinone/menaquinone biosynthesis C-methylase UbiE